MTVNTDPKNTGATAYDWSWINFDPTMALQPMSAGDGMSPLYGSDLYDHSLLSGYAGGPVNAPIQGTRSGIFTNPDGTYQVRSLIGDPSTWNQGDNSHLQPWHRSNYRLVTRPDGTRGLEQISGWERYQEEDSRNNWEDMARFAAAAALGGYGAYALGGAGGVLGAEAAGAGAGEFAAIGGGSAATTPALIESAAGTAGYGASSAGAGGGAGVLAGGAAAGAAGSAAGAGAGAAGAAGGSAGGLGGAASGVASALGNGSTSGWGSALSAIGALGQAYLADNAMRDASRDQRAAAEAAIAEQRRQFDAMRTGLQPYTEAGGRGLAGYGDLAGINGAEAQRAAIAALEGSPTMQALTRQGEQALLQNASATGGLRGGNIQGALAEFRPNMLYSQIQDQYGRLGSLASIGQNSAAMVGNAGMNSANSVSALMQQQGAASAGASLGRARNWSNLLNTGAQIFGQYGQSKGWI